VPRGLERQLLASYVIAFALTLLLVGLVVRGLYVTSLERQFAGQLDILAHGGLSSVRFTGERFEVHEDIATVQSPREQGLEWFDRAGHVLFAEGAVPDAKALHADAKERLVAGPISLETIALPIVSPATHARIGTLRASLSDLQIKSDIHVLDLSLLAASLLGLIASSIAGNILSSQATRRIEASYRSLQTFTADASHELRGPLTVITSNADAALRDDDGIRPQDAARFGAIARTAKRMGTLTEQLLMLARADQSLARDLFVVDLGAIVEKLVGSYGPQFEAKRIRLSATVSPAITVYGNPDQIELMLTNLMQNALRYTPENGRVEIDARSERTSVVVTVRDSGIGIAPENLARIFDRFWRVDGARSATNGASGLGLAILQTLVHRHGGKVTVRSRLGEGSEFTVSLPNRPPRQ
jgi:OmpR-family two-component system manganese-sensing sensor histidine kinase